MLRENIYKQTEIIFNSPKSNDGETYIYSHAEKTLYGSQINQEKKHSTYQMNEMVRMEWCAFYGKRDIGVLICAVVLHVFVHVAVNLVVSIYCFSCSRYILHTQRRLHFIVDFLSFLILLAKRFSRTDMILNWNSG